MISQPSLSWLKIPSYVTHSMIENGYSVRGVDGAIANNAMGLKG